MTPAPAPCHRWGGRNRTAAPADFLWQCAASTPLAAAVGALDEAGRSALEHVVVEHWERLADGGPLVLGGGVVPVTGRSPIA